MVAPDGAESVSGGRATVDRSPYYLETSMPGLFAAGDVRHGDRYLASENRLRRIVSVGMTADVIVETAEAEKVDLIMLPRDHQTSALDCCVIQLRPRY